MVADDEKQVAAPRLEATSIQLPSGVCFTASPTRSRRSARSSRDRLRRRPDGCPRGAPVRRGVVRHYALDELADVDLLAGEDDEAAPEPFDVEQVGEQSLEAPRRTIKALTVSSMVSASGSRGASPGSGRSPGSRSAVCGARARRRRGCPRAASYLPLLGHVLRGADHRRRTALLPDDVAAAEHDALLAVRPQHAVLEAKGSPVCSARPTISAGTRGRPGGRGAGRSRRRGSGRRAGARRRETARPTRPPGRGRRPTPSYRCGRATGPLRGGPPSAPGSSSPPRARRASRRPRAD